MRLSLIPLLMLCMAAAHGASVGYITFGTGSQNTGNITNLNAVFGNQGSTTWQSLGSGNVTSSSLSGYRFLFIDGGTAGGNTFRDWLNTNITVVQNYVAAGGRLYIDSGRTSGTNTINAGFGGVQIARLSGNAPGNTGIAATPLSPIFSGGAGLTWTASGNNDFASDYIIAGSGGGTTRIRDVNTGRTLLLEQTWGNGMAWFGGFDATSMATGFQTPTSVLFQNMLNYMANSPPPNPGVPEPSTLLLLACGCLGLTAARRYRNPAS